MTGRNPFLWCDHRIGLHMRCMAQTANVCLIAVLLAVAPVEATTVLAIRQGEHILIAADSLRIGTTVQGDDVPHPACKVKSYGDIVYAAAGRYQPPAISPDALAAHLLPRYESEPIRSRIARFELNALLAFGLYDARGVMPNRHVIFEYLIGFFESGYPVLVTQRFWIDGGRLILETQREIGNNVLLLLGEASAIEQLAGRVFQSEEYSAMFKEIIRRQALHTPRIVGEPADIIRLTADGAEWLKLKGSCLERETE